MHRRVATPDVLRLSRRASTDDGELTRAPKCGQSTRVAIATRGRRTKAAPMAATARTGDGRRIDSGIHRGYGFPNPASARTDCAGLLVTKVLNAAAREEFLLAATGAIG
jgi:hypothetical protein